MNLERLTKDQYKLINSIDGWLTEPEANLLFTLAKKCKGKGVIVEIGTWKGKSTICLAFGSTAGKKVKVITIDPHTGGIHERKLFKKPIWTYDEFKKNLLKAGLTKQIIAKVTTSEDVVKKWKSPVELLWIDGSHVYEDIKRDFEMWLPFVINGGIVVMHDTINIKGPRKVAIEKIYKSDKFKDVRVVDSITFAKKVRKNNAKDKIRNRFILLINKFSSFIFKVPTPAIIRVVGKKFLRTIQ